MVCWQQAKMLYKYRGPLHTRMRTHTPPDEQNQSSGTAELRSAASIAPNKASLISSTVSAGPGTWCTGGVPLFVSVIPSRRALSPCPWSWSSGFACDSGAVEFFPLVPPVVLATPLTRFAGRASAVHPLPGLRFEVPLAIYYFELTPSTRYCSRLAGERPLPRIGLPIGGRTPRTLVTGTARTLTVGRV